MDSALRFALDLGGVLSLVSLGAFMAAGLHLIRDGWDRTDAAKRTGWSTFLTSLF